MKKKKCLMVSVVTIVCIFILTFTITSINKIRTIGDLMCQLEDAVNKCEINSIINLYPDYYQDTVSDWLSQNKIEEFHNKVGDININIIGSYNEDSESMSYEIEDEIKTKYNVDIDIQDTQLITINYHENFGESTFYVVKIRNEYYLYSDAVLPEPIQYFVE